MRSWAAQGAEGGFVAAAALLPVDDVESGDLLLQGRVLFGGLPFDRPGPVDHVLGLGVLQSAGRVGDDRLLQGAPGGVPCLLAPRGPALESGEFAFERGALRPQVSGESDGLQAADQFVALRFGFPGLVTQPVRCGEVLFGPCHLGAKAVDEGGPAGERFGEPAQHTQVEGVIDRGVRVVFQAHARGQGIQEAPHGVAAMSLRIIVYGDQDGARLVGQGSAGGGDVG
ncbi:hypothetical protein ACFQ0G_11530 [Streptomyces chiangmaiensis]